MLVRVPYAGPVLLVLLYILVAPAAGVWAADGVIGSDEYLSDQDLGGGSLHLYWNTAGENLTMGMEAPVTGWVAVGFSPTTRMKDADIILGGVADGKPYTFDMNSTGMTGPHPLDTELDGTDDISVFDASETDGTTIVEFSRLLRSGDSLDALLLPGTDTEIIWATGSTDTPDMMHASSRGRATIRL